MKPVRCSSVFDQVSFSYLHFLLLIICRAMVKKLSSVKLGDFVYPPPCFTALVYMILITYCKLVASLFDNHRSENIAQLCNRPLPTPLAMSQLCVVHQELIIADNLSFISSFYKLTSSSEFLTPTLVAIAFYGLLL